jgi:class 3 adenylate cyclase/HAMP domain-containing protein
VSVRLKIILIVLPLLIITLVLSSIASSLSARNGITRVAVELLAFKAQDMQGYLENQWNLLVENQLDRQSEYILTVQRGALTYALSLISSETELLFALDRSNQMVLTTTETPLTDQERQELADLRGEQTEGWVELSIAGAQRVGHAFTFEPFGWFFLVTEERQTFFRDVTEITTQNAIILAGASAVSVLLLLLFSGYLTGPITRMVAAMQEIIHHRNLSERVRVEYQDEIGTLAHTFNITISELEKAYNQIKNFAFKAVLAKQHEQEIRNIFQKYVPKEVIDRFFKNPESLLIGEDRVLAVLFADIRGFTTITELMRADEMVQSLNSYFSLMVDTIMNRDGIVDKYIGDAIMAFFGAPVQHTDDALQAVLTALEMQEALGEFNKQQAADGKPEFRIGIGINYGMVTVGNIGSEKKMDYTVIGDMVNLASRLENLTKIYKQDVIISESVYREVKLHLPCRLIDKVAVLGMSQFQRIFTVKNELNEEEKRAWQYHQKGLQLYYHRKFKDSAKYFRHVGKLIPGDVVSAMYFDRCKSYLKQPPPAKWNGVQVLTEK